LSDGLVEVNIRAVRAALLVRAALRVRTRGYDLPSARERWHGVARRRGDVYGCEWTGGFRKDRGL